METKHLLIQITIITLLTLISLPNFPPITAQNSTEIKVINPTTGLPTFNYTSPDITGERFNLTVQLFNVENLFAYQVYLKINGTMLNITRAWLPTWDSNWIFAQQSLTVQPSPDFYDDNGDGVMESVLIGDSILVGSAVTGNGLLAIIELEIILAPPLGEELNSTLNINNKLTYLLDDNLNRIPSTIYDGEYSYLRVKAPEPWLEVTPKTLTFGPLPPSVVNKVFTIQVYVKNLDEQIRLTKISFTLAFNNSLITLYNITANQIWLNITNITKPGEIRIILENPSVTPEGNLSLTTIKFKILLQPKYPTVYQTPLTLSEISLTNPAGEISIKPPINGTLRIEGIVPTPWLEVTPNTIEFGPEPYLGKHFNLSIELKGIHPLWELVSLSITLTYNSTLVQLINITEGTFLPTISKTYFKYASALNHVNITQGFTQQTSKFPSGDGTIATLTFNIIRQEPNTLKFPLNLINIKLINKNGNTIPINPFKTINGFCQLNRALEISNLTLTVSPKITEVGSDITISGKLMPEKKNVEITIYYKLEGETIWKKLNTETVLTDGSGQYQYIWSINQTGIYQIYSEWQGDATTLPAKSNIETVVFETPAKPSQPPLQTLLIITALLITITIMAILLYKLKKQKKLLKK